MDNLTIEKYLSELYLKSQPLRSGYSHNLLSKLLRLDALTSDNILHYLKKKGLIDTKSGYGDNVLLTAQGIDGVLASRQDKTFKVIRFTEANYIKASLQAQLKEGYLYRYILNNEDKTVGENTIVVLASAVMINKWKLSVEQRPKDVEKIFLQFAVDTVLEKLKQGTLNQDEEVDLTTTMIQQEHCPYYPNDLIETEEAEFEVETFSLSGTNVHVMCDYGKDYIIRRLTENNGVFNFYHLEPTKFSNEPERLAIIQELKDEGHIKNLDSAIGQTYMLTEKFRNEQLAMYKELVLSKINKMEDQESSWDKVISELVVPEMYKKNLTKMLELQGYITFTTRTMQGDLFSKGHKMVSYFLDSVELPQNEHVQNRAKGKPQIFFSYAWREGEHLVDELYASLKNDGGKEGYLVLRDKETVQYRGAISEFIKEIGTGSYVIIAISDKYLKSHYCMFELYELFRNSKLDSRELIKKIFPIKVEKINLGDPRTLGEYFDYWQSEEQNWEKLITNPRVSSEQKAKHGIVKDIANSLGRLLAVLADMNSLNTKELIANDFAEIKNAIRKSIIASK